ncbi:MAG: rod shape-determining protein MreC [Terriglobales bacterium]
MENIINRHRNLTILAAVLFAQILGLAVQVKRGTDQGTSRLIRIWAVSAITPIEKGVGHTSRWIADTWHNYLYLRGVRAQNQKLREEIEHMRLEQVRMSEDAGQARRLQSLLGFKEEFISQTMPAQVISTTGSEFSRGVFIDKGSRDGIKADMPVITPDGIVGKVFRVYPTSSLVLEINDSSSGAGVIMEKSRLQGILKGSPTGQTFVANIMADEKIEPGERILTSGGDRVYPKGMAVGTVSRVNPAGTFLNVEVKPSAQLNGLEEVLVITKIVEKAPEVNDQSAPVRAIDILAQRLPSVPPPKPPDAKKPDATKPSATAQGRPTTGTNPNLEAAPPPAVPPETAGPSSTAAKPAPSAEKNAASAKAAVETAKPETTVKDTPR